MSRMPAVPAIALTSNPLPGADRIGAPFARWNSHDLAGHVGQQLCGRVDCNQTIAISPGSARGVFPLAGGLNFHVLTAAVAAFKNNGSVFFSAISTGVMETMSPALSKCTSNTTRPPKCALAKASGYLTD